MSEPGKNEQHKAPLHRRLAIFQGGTGEKVQLGRMTITKTEDGNADAKLEAADDETLKRIKHLVDADALKASTSGKKPLEEIMTDLKKMIEGAGFQAEDLPDSDYQLMMTFDVNTGRVIATQKAMHPYAGGADDLASNMLKSIKEMFASVPTKVAEKIVASVAAGDHAKAVEELETAVNEGQLGFAPNPALLDALSSIDLNVVSEEKKWFVRDALLRTAQQLNRIDIAARQAEHILAERPSLTDFEKSDLEMTIAYGAVKDGHFETAMTIWRRLLKTPEKMMPESRGWALRNISLTLDIQDPETLDTARRSADAFLEAGNKDEAGRSLMRMSKALLHKNPQEAIEILNQIETFANQEGLHQKEMLSALYHARANRLSALGAHERALADAMNAVELKRCLIGLESELISSLYLVEQELHQLGRHDEAKAYAEDAAHLTETTGDAYFKLANRVTALMSNFDQAEADAILTEARSKNRDEIVAAVQTLTATMAPNLTDTQRLSLLEACLKEQDKKGMSESAKLPACQALVQQLERMGALDRAEIWLRKILAGNPIDHWARNALIDILWKQEKWGDAAIFLRKQIEISGDMPGLNFALGKSLLKAGTLDDAIAVLHKASNLTTNPGMKKAALALRDEALDKGGTIRPPKAEALQDAPITSDLFEQALHEFCRFVTSDKRMTFWTMGATDYEWIPRPEGHAQTLLHTYLKGKFGERINVFEEIKTGAGRLDIYVQLKGALALVVELKMCGGGYSTTYAASGEDQVLHYLESRHTKSWVFSRV